MKISILILGIFISWCTTHAQEISTPVSHAIIEELIGDAEYRSRNTPDWKPLTNGTFLTKNHFIRLTSNRSRLKIKLADGSILTFIGLTAAYLNLISEPEKNIYKSNIFFLTGQWFYQSSPYFASYMIVNTDTLKSTIQKGSGGGRKHKDTYEFFIHKGLGTISQKNQSSLEQILQDNQMIIFKKNTGFSPIRLIQEQELVSPAINIK